MKIRIVLFSHVTALIGLLGGTLVSANETDARNVTIVQYGKMHEAIGQKQHQGRIAFADLTKRPHFFGVAALEGLSGEATIYDGKVTVTTVDKNGRPQGGDEVSPNDKATMLVGAYVASWSRHKVAKTVSPDAFGGYIESVAAEAGMNVDEPFVFSIEGEFFDVDLHVINGACPIHARVRKIELPKRLQPFEAELAKVDGKVVGVFAKDAVGDLTHPATSTHTHLLYVDPATGKTVTGHVESIGLHKGAVLRLPRK